MKKEVKACDLKVGDSFTFDTNLGSTVYTVTVYTVTETNNAQNNLYKLSCKIIDPTIETSKQIHTPMNSVATTFKPVQCECGAHKLGYSEGPAHSTWCELYRKEII